MNFKNLTPHDVIVNWDSSSWKFESEGTVRLDQQDSGLRNVGSLGIPVVDRSYGSSNLPAETEGVGLIVSQMVAAAFPERRDLYYPGDLIRDDKGNITGCKNLCQVAKNPLAGEDPFEFPQYATAKAIFPDAKG